jgi:DNA modification methylase
MSVRIITGDCREVLRTLPDDSVHCVVTSPPYFNLRDYGQAGQIGLEHSFVDFVAAVADVFDEVRRVLRTDGIVWLNLGDSYAGSWGAQSREHAGKHAPNVSALSANQVKAAGIRASGTGAASRSPGLKPKDMIGVPWRVAFEMQRRGWWLRQRLPWVKRNPMPESTRDRPTSAVEEVFLLTKSDTYFYDYDAVKRRRTSDEDANGFRGGAYVGGNIDNDTCGVRTSRGNKRVDKQRGHSRRHAGFNDRWDAMEREEQRGARAFRNTDLFFDSVDAPHGAICDALGRIIALDVATQPFRESHFATFPPHLIEPLIRAGCPAGGTVLDPFGGAGTTGLVADRLGRDAILIELNPDYAEMARKRIAGEAGMFADVVNDAAANETPKQEALL